MLPSHIIYMCVICFWFVARAFFLLCLAILLLFYIECPSQRAGLV